MPLFRYRYSFHKVPARQLIASFLNYIIIVRKIYKLFITNAEEYHKRKNGPEGMGFDVMPRIKEGRGG